VCTDQSCLNETECSDASTTGEHCTDYGCVNTDCSDSGLPDVKCYDSSCSNSTNCPDDNCSDCLCTNASGCSDTGTLSLGGCLDTTCTNTAANSCTDGGTQIECTDLMCKNSASNACNDMYGDATDELCYNENEGSCADDQMCIDNACINNEGCIDTYGCSDAPCANYNIIKNNCTNGGDGEGNKCLDDGCRNWNCGHSEGDGQRGCTNEPFCEDSSCVEVHDCVDGGGTQSCSDTNNRCKWPLDSCNNDDSVCLDKANDCSYCTDATCINANNCVDYAEDFDINKCTDNECVNQKNCADRGGCYDDKCSNVKLCTDENSCSDSTNPDRECTNGHCSDLNVGAASNCDLNPGEDSVCHPWP